LVPVMAQQIGLTGPRDNPVIWHMIYADNVVNIVTNFISEVLEGLPCRRPLSDERKRPQRRRATTQFAL
jgi:hypothetical protein